MNSNSLKSPQWISPGFRVCITGGGGHLGSAIALRLAEENAKVMILGRTESRLKTVQNLAESFDFHGRIFYQVADVTSLKDINMVLNWMFDNWGGVDGWVNNAASSAQSLLIDLEQDKVAYTLRNCLESVMVTTDAVSQAMIANKSQGSIVNIASMYGIVSPNPETYINYKNYHNPPAYGAAKAGIIQFSRYLACHLASYGIRVNTVSPGPFPQESVQESKGFIRELEKRVPLGRIGKPHEVADPVVFLLSDRSSYITGHNLVVDGGWTAW